MLLLCSRIFFLYSYNNHFTLQTQPVNSNYVSMCDTVIYPIQYITVILNIEYYRVGRPLS